MAEASRLAVPWGIKEALLFMLGWTVLPSVVLVFLFRSAPVALGGDSPLVNLGLLLLDGAIGLGLIWYFLKQKGAGLRDLGLRQFRLWESTLILLATLVFFWVAVTAAYWLVDVLVPSFNPDQEQVNEFTEAMGTPLGRAVSFIALVLIPPVLEEISFRGFLFPAFSHRLGVWGAAIVSSALFGLAHFQFNISVYTLVLGLLLCMMYYKLGSIWPGIALHMINNGLAYWTLLS